MSTEKINQSQNKKSYGNHRHTHYCFEKISMDIVGPLPETKSGNLYINFTKYSLAIPLSNHQASTIADAFVKKFICIFGSPKGVLTHQGRDFLSNLLKRLAKRFRIKQFRSRIILVYMKAQNAHPMNWFLVN